MLPIEHVGLTGTVTVMVIRPQEASDLFERRSIRITNTMQVFPLALGEVPLRFLQPACALK